VDSQNCFKHTAFQACATMRLGVMHRLSCTCRLKLYSSKGRSSRQRILCASSVRNTTLHMQACKTNITNYEIQLRLEALRTQRRPCMRSQFMQPILIFNHEINGESPGEATRSPGGAKRSQVLGVSFIPRSSGLWNTQTLLEVKLQQMAWHL